MSKHHWVGAAIGVAACAVGFAAWTWHCRRAQLRKLQELDGLDCLVSSTASSVAVSRALGTLRPGALVHDPLAIALVSEQYLLHTLETMAALAANNTLQAPLPSSAQPPPSSAQLPPSSAQPLVQGQQQQEQEGGPERCMASSADDGSCSSSTWGGALHPGQRGGAPRAEEQAGEEGAGEGQGEGEGADAPAVCDLICLRTRYIDDGIEAAVEELSEACGGAVQVVLLGSGMDSRPWRLHLPAPVHWFEVDRDDVTAAKLTRLMAAGAQVGCTCNAAQRRQRQPNEAPAGVSAAGFGILGVFATGAEERRLPYDTDPAARLPSDTDNKHGGDDHEVCSSGGGAGSGGGKAAGPGRGSLSGAGGNVYWSGDCSAAGPGPGSLGGRACDDCAQEAAFPMLVSSWAQAAVDLSRPGWTKALRAAGFDPGMPTVWVAEGLLYYLPWDKAQVVVRDAAAATSPGVPAALLATYISHAMRRNWAAAAAREPAYAAATTFASSVGEDEPEACLAGAWRCVAQPVDQQEMAAEYGIALVRSAADTGAAGLHGESRYFVLAAVLASGSEEGGEEDGEEGIDE